jgi:hypothetical protein
VLKIVQEALGIPGRLLSDALVETSYRETGDGGVPLSREEERLKRVSEEVAGRGGCIRRISVIANISGFCATQVVGMLCRCLVSVNECRAFSS